MDHGMDIGTQLVHLQVHADLGRDLHTPGHLGTFQVADGQHVFAEESLADPGGGAQDPVVAHADTDIAVVGSHVSPLVSPFPDFDDVSPQGVH